MAKFRMTKYHIGTVILAVVSAVGILLAMVFGHEATLESIGVNRTVRDVAIALWAFLLPAWFTLEEAWFAPPDEDTDAVAAFQRLQTRGRLTWTIAAGAIAIVIGTSAPATAGAETDTAPAAEENRSG